MTRPGVELRSPGPLANTLPMMPMSGKMVKAPAYWAEMWEELRSMRYTSK